MKELKLGVIYARFSNGPQQTEQSIEGQLYDCNRYAAEHGITIIDIYKDEAISGKEDYNRPGFQRMLSDAEDGKFQYIIVWKIDRFGRNREELAINKSRLKKCGVQLLYAAESIPEGPEGVLLESLLEGLAEYYSADLRQKVTRGLLVSARKGKVFGQVPLGYVKSEYGLEIDEKAADMVRSVFNRYADGDMAKDIVKDVNAAGLRNAMGNPFTTSAIYHMLENRRYLGEYTYRGELIEGAIPPIIDEVLWDRVQKRKKMNQHSPAAYKAKIRFMLTGKVTCGICGEHYVGEAGTSRNGTVHHYYKCHGKKNKHIKCDSRIFRKAELEDAIMLHTFQDILTDKVIDELADTIVMMQKEKARKNYALNTLKKELKSVEKDINNIINAITDGMYHPSMKEKMTELENRKADLRLAIAKETVKKQSLTKDMILFWLEQFRDGEIEEPGFQQRIVDSFINHIIVYKDSLLIAYNFVGNEKTISLDDATKCVRIQSHLVDLIQLNTNIFVSDRIVYLLVS